MGLGWLDNYFSSQHCPLTASNSRYPRMDSLASLCQGVHYICDCVASIYGKDNQQAMNSTLLLAIALIITIIVNMTQSARIERLEDQVTILNTRLDTLPALLGGIR